MSVDGHLPAPLWPQNVVRESLAHAISPPNAWDRAEPHPGKQELPGLRL